MARVKLTAAQFLAVLVLLAVWQLVASLGLVSELFVSTPIKVARNFGELVTTQSLYPNIWVTTQELLIGLGIGSAAGIASGVVLGFKPYLYRVFSPTVSTLYTMPRLALLPLFVLWFGLGMASKVALVVSLVYFSMLLNTYAGVREVDTRLVDTVKLMGGGRLAVIRDVIFPAILPWLLAGLRVSLVFAVTGAVIGEMLAGQQGLGYLITQRGEVFDTPGLLALLVVVAVMTVILNGAIGALERYLTPWKPDSGRVRLGRRKARRASARPSVADAGPDLPTAFEADAMPGQVSTSVESRAQDAQIVREITS